MLGVVALFFFWVVCRQRRPAIVDNLRSSLSIMAITTQEKNQGGATRARYEGVATARDFAVATECRERGATTPRASPVSGFSRTPGGYYLDRRFIIFL